MADGSSAQCLERVCACRSTSQPIIVMHSWKKLPISQSVYTPICVFVGNSLPYPSVLSALFSTAEILTAMQLELSHSSTVDVESVQYSWRPRGITTMISFQVKGLAGATPFDSVVLFCSVHYVFFYPLSPSTR